MATPLGTLLSARALLPSWPTPPEPQHFAPGLVAPVAVRRAHVWPLPAEMAETPVLMPKTSTGARVSLLLALPSWPKWLSPQHFAPPAVVTAHV